jgi:hypothetical protein
VESNTDFLAHDLPCKLKKALLKTIKKDTVCSAQVLFEGVTIHVIFSTFTVNENQPGDFIMKTLFRISRHNALVVVEFSAVTNSSDNFLCVFPWYLRPGLCSTLFSYLLHSTYSGVFFEVGMKWSIATQCLSKDELEKYPLSPLSKVTIYHALRSPVANKSI